MREAGTWRNALQGIRWDCTHPWANLVPFHSQGGQKPVPGGFNVR